MQKEQVYYRSSKGVFSHTVLRRVRSIGNDLVKNRKKAIREIPRIAFSNAKMCPLGLFLDEQLCVLVYAQKVDSRGNGFCINNGCSIK